MILPTCTRLQAKKPKYSSLLHQNTLATRGERLRPDPPPPTHTQAPICVFLRFWFTLGVK
ncbi:hypothetical protein Hanom_Chr12g01123371 [Helianthus anomalus]